MSRPPAPAIRLRPIVGRRDLYAAAAAAAAMLDLKCYQFTGYSQHMPLKTRHVFEKKKER